MLRRRTKNFFGNSWSWLASCRRTTLLIIFVGKILKPVSPSPTAAIERFQDNKNRAIRRFSFSPNRPEHLPYTWNHVIEKESLNFKELEHVRIEKVCNFFGTCLSYDFFARFSQDGLPPASRALGFGRRGRVVDMLAATL